MALAELRKKLESTESDSKRGAVATAAESPESANECGAYDAKSRSLRSLNENAVCSVSSQVGVCPESERSLGGESQIRKSLKIKESRSLRSLNQELYACTHARPDGYSGLKRTPQTPQTPTFLNYGSCPTCRHDIRSDWCEAGMPAGPGWRWCAEYEGR